MNVGGMGNGLGLIAVVSIAVCCASASAQNRDSEARLLFEAGRSAYEDGRFEDALARFREAYALSQRPALRFNIAAALDRLVRAEEAIAEYRAYLEAVPQAENRSYVESRIRILDELLSRQAAGNATERAETAQSTDATQRAETMQSTDAAQSADGEQQRAEAAQSADGEQQPAEAAPGSEPPQGGLDAGPAIVLFVVAGLAGGVGIGTGVAALGIRSNLDAMCPGGTCDPSLRARAEEMQTLGIVTDVLLATSLVSAGTAAVLLAVGASGGGREGADLAFVPLPGGAATTFRMRF